MSLIKPERLKSKELSRLKKKLAKRHMKCIAEHINEIERQRSLINEMKNVRITLSLVDDCYSKAFRAFHYVSCAKL